MLPRVSWPDGKRFAFTVVDDTDSARVEDVRPVYDLLADLGFRTTKTVWSLRSAEGTALAGDTLEDDGYLAWIRGLQERGFEIGYHGAAADPSLRDRSERGLAVFRAQLGGAPRVYASHAGQIEAMYWGDARLVGGPRALFSIANKLVGREMPFQGEAEASPYFWGDLCRDGIEYARNFTFTDINTLACDPAMPYHDPAKPYVKYWFSSSNGPTCREYTALLGEANQDALAEQGGACIVYTHFAYGFVREGRLEPAFVRLMTRLASMGGWYVPASRLLDHLRARPGWRPDISPRTLRAMQWRWVRDALVGAGGAKYARRIARRFGLRR